MATDPFFERLLSATPRTTVTTVLVALNVLVWIANVATGLDPMTPGARQLAMWGGNYLPLTIEQPWRLFTAAFLHGGIIHLAFNMWALLDTGRIAERFYGHAQFLLIYLGSALFGSLASLFFSASKVVSVGASGAIFGVVGALLAALFHKHHHLPPALVTSMRSSMLMFAGYSLFMGFVSSHIDNAAHLGGMAAGALLGLVLAEVFDWDEYRRQASGRLMIALAAVVAGAWVVWQMVPVRPAL